MGKRMKNLSVHKYCKDEMHDLEVYTLMKDSIHRGDDHIIAFKWKRS